MNYCLVSLFLKRQKHKKIVLKMQFPVSNYAFVLAFLKDLLGEIFLEIKTKNRGVEKVSLRCLLLKEETKKHHKSPANYFCLFDFYNSKDKHRREK